MKVNDKNIRIIIDKAIGDLNNACSSITQGCCERNIKQAMVRLETIKDIVEWE